MRAPHAVRTSPSATVRLAVLGVLLLVACARREGCTGDYCGTLVIATAGEPQSLLPPLLTAAVDQAVSDQLFLRLADIGRSTNTVGDEDFQPQLAQRGEWADSVTLVFHLDPRARWVEMRSEEHTSELQSRLHLVCRLLLLKKNLNSAMNCILHQLDC